MEGVWLLRALWVLVDASGKSFWTLSIQREQQLEGSDSTTAPYNGRTWRLKTNRSPRDVSSTGLWAHACALYFLSRFWRSRLPAVRHFRLTRRVVRRHFLPLPVWTVSGGGPALRRSPSLLPPSLSLP